MSPARQADSELNDLIDEITVDCHDEYEQLTAFETAFDNDATLPWPRHRRRRGLPSEDARARPARREPIGLVYHERPATSAAGSAADIRG